MPNDSVESKQEAPGIRVTVSLPAFTISLIQVSRSPPKFSSVRRYVRINLIGGRIATHTQDTILGLDPDVLVLGQK
jgi:hypothetical protein